MVALRRWLGSAVLLAGLVLVLGGCGDDDGGGYIPPPPQGSISFTVDGTPKTYSTSAVGQTDGTFTIIGAEASSGPSLIAFIIDGVIAGTYTVTADTLMVAYVDDVGTSFAAINGLVGSGSVTITSFGAVGGRIEGTFFAVVDDGASTTLDIISGTFSVVREPDA